MNPWKDNWKKRPTYVTKSITDHFPFFIASQKIKNNGQKQIVSVKDFSVVSILKLLSCVEKEEKSFTDMYNHSGISSKNSFINYLNLCKMFKFVSRRQSDYRNRVFYKITQKGLIFMDLFKIEEEVLA